VAAADEYRILIPTPASLEFVNLVEVIMTEDNIELPKMPMKDFYCIDI